MGPKSTNKTIQNQLSVFFHHFRGQRQFMDAAAAAKPQSIQNVTQSGIMVFHHQCTHYQMAG